MTCSIFIASTTATCCPCRLRRRPRRRWRRSCPGSARHARAVPSGPATSPPPARRRLFRRSAFTARVVAKSASGSRRRRPRAPRGRSVRSAGGAAAPARSAAAARRRRASVARCSSTQRVWTRPRRSPDGRARVCAGTGCSSDTLESELVECPRRPRRARRRGRRAWPITFASSESNAVLVCSRRIQIHRSGRRARRAARRR